MVGLQAELAALARRRERAVEEREEVDSQHLAEKQACEERMAELKAAQLELSRVRVSFAH